MSLNGILERDFCVLRVIFLRFARQATETAEYFRKIAEKYWCFK